jgi:hypothetical protein
MPLPPSPNLSSSSLPPRLVQRPCYRSTFIAVQDSQGPECPIYLPSSRSLSPLPPGQGHRPRSRSVTPLWNHSDLSSPSLPPRVSLRHGFQSPSNTVPDSQDPDFVGYLSGSHSLSPPPPGQGYCFMPRSMTPLGSQGDQSLGQPASQILEEVQEDRTEADAKSRSDAGARDGSGACFSEPVPKGLLQDSSPQNPGIGSGASRRPTDFCRNLLPQEIAAVDDFISVRASVFPCRSTKP